MHMARALPAVALNRIAPSRRESRALVVLSPMAEHAERMAAYRHAPFLPSSLPRRINIRIREHRRAEPNVAVAAYRATAALSTF
jgi:hypothetical protein